MLQPPYRRLVPASAAGLTRLETTIIDGQARSDARADFAAGGEHRYRLMRQRHATRQLRDAAWQRYGIVYESEALSLAREHVHGTL
ncbi:MAG TPA: hypothetical protein VHB98_23595 [Chloroflexota bacterium]|nr:hypothetical protein [Chloroflexota bacterium]